MPVYATPQELAAWLELDEPPAGASQALRDASLAVDMLLVGAVYAVDDEEQPTDPKVIAALRDATCAQAAFKPKGSNTPAPEGGRPSAVKVDKVSTNFATNPVTGAVVEDTYSQQAANILRLAGLVPAHPVVI